jgi:hypothetical protein
MKNLIKINFLIAVASIIMWTSCKVEKINPVIESDKDITGTWGLLKVTRNGADITDTFDFSIFKINFSGNNYTIGNQLPFLVGGNGTYKLDDPQYSFKISFTPTGGSEKSSSLGYPIVNGIRTLSIEFANDDCVRNKYVYTFAKQ